MPFSASQLIVLVPIALIMATALAVLLIVVLPITTVPLSYNWRNLTVRWKTTALTALGFTLVIGLLVVMLAFVEGLNALSAKSGPEGNVIVLRDGATDELFSDIAIDEQVSKLWNQPEVLLDSDRETRLASQEVYSIATQELPPDEPGGRAKYRFLQIRGVEKPEVAGKVHALQLTDGRWFSRVGTEVVMGDGIARQLSKTVGDTFEPRPGLNWTVVGILDSRGSPFDSEIWAKLEEVGRYFGKDNVERGQRFYTSIVLATPDGKTAEKLAEELKGRTSMSISVMTERKYYEELSKSNLMFMAFAVFIAAVMAIGGMLGLMTTMFAAVSQRIKDIGVLRIMGFRRWQILHSLLLESLLFAFLGGGLGILIGYYFNGIEQTSLLSSGQASKTVVFTMIVNRTVLIYAVGFTLVMGLLGGLLPALSAMRLKLLDALR